MEQNANLTPTPHNAAKMGEIAETVLMPGDPLRAKFIAETFLEDVSQYNQIRGMNGYTGTYKGKRVSVQGHGMGNTPLQAAGPFIAIGLTGHGMINSGILKSKHSQKAICVS